MTYTPFTNSLTCVSYFRDTCLFQCGEEETKLRAGNKTIIKTQSQKIKQEGKGKVWAPSAKPGEKGQVRSPWEFSTETHSTSILRENIPRDSVLTNPGCV